MEENKDITPLNGTVFVKGSTSTKGLATCIFASATKERRDEIRLRGIGASATNQMSKAYIIAKGKLMEKGISTLVDMCFRDIKSTDESSEVNITAIEYVIKFTY